VHPPPPEMTCDFLIQLVLLKKTKTVWFIGVEVEQETSASPPKKKSWIRPCVCTLKYEIEIDERY